MQSADLWVGLPIVGCIKGEQDAVHPPTSWDNTSNASTNSTRTADEAREQATRAKPSHDMIERRMLSPSTTADMEHLPGVVALSATTAETELVPKGTVRDMPTTTAERGIFSLTSADDSASTASASCAPAHKTSIWIGSWNLENQWPTSDELLQFLPPLNTSYGMILIGVRNPLWKQKWVPYLDGWLADAGYVLIKTLCWRGICLTLFATKEQSFSVHDVQTAIVDAPTWRSPYGTLQIRCTLGSTSCLFAYADFPSKVGADAERDALFLNAFGHSPLKPRHWTAQQHVFLTNRVFLFGGLNYGAQQCGDQSQSLTSCGAKCETREECSERYKVADSLVSRINNISKDGAVPSQATLLWGCFSESALDFPPTNKFYAQSNDYDHGVALSWPERIMWKREDTEPSAKEEVICRSYGSRDVRTSRSRPVIAEFEVEYTGSPDRSFWLKEKKPPCCAMM
eukprot:GEMP01032485.1.p1 GENE.GEMP01032485.1~~GEMP01032485.1.p1  ORF type:complete len:456 (+),score=82.56 GEMP01032485.1:10-1377(+)